MYRILRRASLTPLMSPVGDASIAHLASLVVNIMLDISGSERVVKV